MTTSRATRVVQWTTGNVGRRSVLAICSNPEFELIGCYAWSHDRAGRDVGEICGLDKPLGVFATNDRAALLALCPDCVVYNPKWPDFDELVAILEAGVNIVSTAGFITGDALGADRGRILEACDRGRSSIFGSGMNPGLANLLGVVSASICDRIDTITITESVDSTGYDSPETELPVGFARPLDDPGLPAMTESGTVVFGDAGVVRLGVGAKENTPSLRHRSPLGPWAPSRSPLCKPTDPDRDYRLISRRKVSRVFPFSNEIPSRLAAGHRRGAGRRYGSTDRCASPVGRAELQKATGTYGR